MKPLLLAVLCAALLGAAPASAARAAARLVIRNGPGTGPCMSDGALRRAVELRLRRKVFRSDLPVTLELQIVFGHDAAGWSAELTMRDGAGVFLGRRSMVTEAAHCSALDDSLALVVALLVDSPPSAPEPAPQPEPPPPAPASAPQAAAAPPPPSNAAEAEPLTTLSVPRTTLAPREPWRLNLSLGAVVALGTIPGVAPGAELALGAQAPRLPELRLFADGYAQRDESRAGSNSGAHFNFVSVGLELCALDVQLGVLRWFGCAGQALGRLKVASLGFDQNSSTAHLTYALLARTGLRFPIAGRFAGRFGIRAELPLAREVFDYGSRDDRERTLYEVKPVTAALDLGLIVQL